MLQGVLYELSFLGDKDDRAAARGEMSERLEDVRERFGEDAPAGE